MDRDVEELSRLSASARFWTLLHRRQGIMLLLAFAAAFSSMIITVGEIRELKRRADVEPAKALRELTAKIVDPVSDSASQMAIALTELRQATSRLPDGAEKASISASADILDRRIRYLQTYTDNLINRERRSEPTWSIFGVAYAEPTSQPARFTVEDARPYAFLVILGALAVTFSGSILLVFFTTDAEVLKFALDTIKTLLGFFIGVATTFLGVPTR